MTQAKIDGVAGMGRDVGRGSVDDLVVYEKGVAGAGGHHLGWRHIYGRHVFCAGRHDVMPIITKVLFVETMGSGPDDQIPGMVGRHIAQGDADQHREAAQLAGRDAVVGRVAAIQMGAERGRRIVHYRKTNCDLAALDGVDLAVTHHRLRQRFDRRLIVEIGYLGRFPQLRAECPRLKGDHLGRIDTVAEGVVDGLDGVVDHYCRNSAGHPHISLLVEFPFLRVG